MKVQAFCEEKGLTSLLGLFGYAELKKKTMLASWKMAFSLSNLHISKMAAKLKKNCKICRIIHVSDAKLVQIKVKVLYIYCSILIDIYITKLASKRIQGKQFKQIFFLPTLWLNLGSGLNKLSCSDGYIFWLKWERYCFHYIIRTTRYVQWEI